MTIASLADLFAKWTASTTHGGENMMDDLMPWDDLWIDIGGEG